MNTKISYLYRDADNYKKFNECVVSGEMTEEMKASILACLDDGEYFIPSQVGLPEVRFGEWTEADHCWFELTEDDFEETSDAPTVGITAEKLVAAFEACRGKWDDLTVPKAAYEASRGNQDDLSVSQPEKNGSESLHKTLTPDEFRDFLRVLQKSPYKWPNLYFAWEKPDGSLFLVGTNSSQQYSMIVKEVNSNDWQNTIRASYGKASEYSSRLYGIAPYCSYMENNQRFDPIERLVSKVSEYSYLGAWKDPDTLMFDPYAYTNVIACGRWELAVSHICPEKMSVLYPEQGAVVDDLLNDAKAREGVEIGEKSIGDKTLD